MGFGGHGRRNLLWGSRCETKGECSRWLSASPLPRSPSSMLFKGTKRRAQSYEDGGLCQAVEKLSRETGEAIGNPEGPLYVTSSGSRSSLGTKSLVPVLVTEGWQDDKLFL